jgi:hypothetical protein
MGNTFIGTPATHKNGLFLTSHLTNNTGTNYIVVGGNIFTDFDAGVLLGGAEGVTVNDDNVFHGCGNNVVDLNNSGGNTVAQTQFSGTGQTVKTDGLITKWGTNVVQLDGNGNGTYSFDTPFPHALLFAIVSNGDPGACGQCAFAVNSNIWSASTLAFGVNPNPGATNVRINWIAIGY